MGKKRVGERTCIGCGAKAHKAELLRFVRTEEGRLCFDLPQKEPGRGGYLCPREACFTLTAKKRRLSVRYRREVKEDPASLMHAVRTRIENDMLKGIRFSTMPPETQDVNVKDRPVPISGPGMIAMHFYSELFSGGSSEWPK